MAKLEWKIEKLYQQLEDVFSQSCNQVRKKQSRTYEEMAAENEAQLNDKKKKFKIDDSEEKPIYNPKNVPLGWDGK